jgi:hypothetical protein
LSRSPPRSRLPPRFKVFHPLLPTKALNAPSHQGCHGQGLDPCLTDSLTPPGSPPPMLCSHTTLVPPSRVLYGHYAGTVRSLCGEAGVIPKRCATCSCPSSTPHPSNESGDTLERHTTTNLMPDLDGAVTQDERSASLPSPPTLCGHLQSCTAIPSAVEPSPMLWGLVLMGHSHTSPCAAQALPPAKPSNRCTDDNQTLRRQDHP